MISAAIGGIYGGYFTPTEAAAVGTLATAYVAWRSDGLSKRGFLECVYGTSQATSMIASAAACSPRCSSIMAPAQTAPIGFAMPRPAMSGAEP